MRRECEASVTVSAPPEAVWAVVSDVTRVGEWSGECRGCEWVGVPGAVTGARFRGHNRRLWLRWTRLNEVVRAEPPRELVWRTVPRFPYPDSIEWRLSLVDTDGGTKVSESYRVVKITKLMEWLVGLAMPVHLDRTADLLADLTRLQGVVESADRRP